MTSHVIDMHSQLAVDRSGEPTGLVRYRWLCSCGMWGRWFASTKESGSAGKAGRSARNGGARHVAAMEQGK